MSWAAVGKVRTGAWRVLFALVLAASGFWTERGRAAPASLPTDDMPSMRFTVVRSNEPGCEPVCPEWIAAEGAIVADTPAQLGRVLKSLDGRRLPIIVNSPGGDVEAAMQLGRTIRKNRLDVAVGKTWFDGCKPDAKDCKANDEKAARFVGHPYMLASMCNSACPLLLAGGVRRFAGMQAFVGVHQVTTVFIKQQVVYKTTYRMVKGKKKIVGKKIVERKGAKRTTTYEMSKGLEKRIAAYLKEMSVDRSVLDWAKSTPASGIRGMSLDEMFKANLLTSFGDASMVTVATLCRRVPAPDNCRLFTVSDLER